MQFLDVLLDVLDGVGWVVVAVERLAVGAATDALPCLGN